MFLVTLAIQISPIMGQNLALIQKAGSLSYQGKFNEALPLFNKMLDSLKAEADKDPGKKQEYLIWLQNKGLIYEHMGDFSTAEQIYQQIILEEINLKNDLDNGYERLRVLNLLSGLYEKMGNNEGAEAILEDLVFSEYANYKESDEKGQFFEFYTRLYNSDAKSKAGLDQMFAIYGISPQLTEPKKAEASTGSDSSALSKKLAKFWAYYLRLKAAATDTASGVNAGYLTMMFPFKSQNIYTQVFTPPTAEQLNTLKEGKEKFGGGRSGLIFNDPWNEVQRLFILYKKLNNYIAAEALIKQAIAVDDKKPDGGDQTMNGLVNMYLKAPMTGEVMKQAGIKNDVAANMNQILNVNNRYQGTDIFYIQNKALLAGLYKDTRQNAEYTLLSDTIYTLCQKLDTVSNPLIASRLADTYTAIGKYDEALSSYKKIINYHKTQSGNNIVSSQLYWAALLHSAQLYKQKGNYEAAKADLLEALVYDKKISGEKYIDHMDRVIALAQLHDDTRDFKLAEQYCARVLESVMNTIRDNFSFLSEREKMSLINNEISAFDFSASLMLHDPKPSDKFITQVYNQQLDLNGLVLTDEQKVFENIRKNGNPVLKKLLTEWQSNKKAIAWQYSQPAAVFKNHTIDSLNTIANEQEKKINLLSNAYLNNNKNRHTDFSEIRKKLGNDEAAIEFTHFKYYNKQWMDSTYYGAFIVLANDSVPHFVPLCEERKLAGLLQNDNSSSKQFIEKLYGNGINPAGNTISGRRSDLLYQLVWQPLQPFLKGINKIYLATAGLLSRVSFNALPGDNDQYLFDKYEIRQCSSIRQIVEQVIPGQIPVGAYAVLFGGIDYGTASEGKFWGPLSTTLDEVNYINTLLAANNIKTILLTNTAASEENLKQLSGHSPYVLHMATHGFSRPLLDTATKNSFSDGNSFVLADDPMLRSGIILANANNVWSGGKPVEGKEDGIVTAYEIANLDLNGTELVVLSACETALGDIRNAEGVFGFQRAFKLAGVHYMLLGSWDLPATETDQLMRDFYTDIFKGASIYPAFKEAQSKLRKNNPPYKWAGMILTE